MLIFSLFIIYPDITHFSLNSYSWLIQPPCSVFPCTGNSETWQIIHEKMQYSTSIEPRSPSVMFMVCMFLPMSSWSSLAATARVLGVCIGSPSNLLTSFQQLFTNSWRLWSCSPTGAKTNTNRNQGLVRNSEVLPSRILIPSTTDIGNRVVLSFL